MNELSARSVAAKVLLRVWDEDAFASAALDAEIKHRPQIDPRDAALATELVYGVLRSQGWLEAQLEARTNRPGSIRTAPRAHLLIGFYSLAFLDRVPTFAAVSEAVDGVREAGNDALAKFANAVLRRFAEACAQKRPSLEDAVVASAPGWLRGALRRSLGRAGATAFLTASGAPPIGIALAPSEDRDAWIQRLRDAAPSASIEAGKVSPRAIVVKSAGDLRKLPGANEAWIVQEEGAQTVALSLGARAGDAVLDACAGRGNKAFLIGQATGGGGGAIDCADVYPAKLDQLREGPVAKLVRATYAVDWTIGEGDIPEGYARVLVDAPCSGIGTLRRRPEIALHRSEDDLARLADLQVAIVKRAATRLAKGGRLVYAVCSVLKEECEAVVERLAPELEPVPFDSEVARAIAGDATSFRLLPHVHGTDGYFVASLSR